MKIDTEFIARVETVPWFVNCGKATSHSFSLENAQLASWHEVDVSFDDNWDVIKQRQFDALTQYLGVNYRSLLNIWNILIKQVRQELSSVIHNRIEDRISELGIDQYFINQPKTTLNLRLWNPVMPLQTAVFLSFI